MARRTHDRSRDPLRGSTGSSHDLQIAHRANQTFVLYAAAAAVALPPLVLLGLYLCAAFKKTAPKGNDGDEDNERVALKTPGSKGAEGDEDKEQRKADLLGLLLNKPTTIAWTQTKTTPEPTSVDFEELFQGLLSAALEDDSRRLVLVVDNLDRIDPVEALSVWSTMRTFFDSEEELDDYRTYLRHLWLVVPFARSGIGRLFRDREATTPHSLDKVFDLVLELPPPIKSRWREYFFRQL